ncbi:MAG: transcriptional regulator, partial [Acidilobaceae archaeon]
MVDDRTIGVVLMIISTLAIASYFWLLFFPPDVRVFGMEISVFVVKATIMIWVLIFFGLIAWIGYTLATTPPPKPIEEIEKEI